MKRHIELTGDGSSTLRVEHWDEPYHSRHGAIQESMHVFIQMGLLYRVASRLRILEIGFGTGLNALLTMLECGRRMIPVAYTGIEAFPVTAAEAGQLNFPELLGSHGCRSEFERMHQAAWEEAVQLTPFFNLLKQKADFLDISYENSFDLVFFDAFGPRVQPELWTEAMFKKMYRALGPNGVLVTYSAKGSVRRAMQAVGFTVQRLPGPPGKREMLRALK